SPAARAPPGMAGVTERLGPRRPRHRPRPPGRPERGIDACSVPFVIRLGRAPASACRRQISCDNWNMSGLKTAVLLAGLSALFLLIGGAVGGDTGLIVAFGFAVVMNIGSYWFSDKIVLRMYKAQPV